jgi:hypothetical protein
MLKNISVSGCPGVDEYGLCTLIPSLPWLRELDLSDCRQVTNNVVKTIAMQTRKSLKKLNLRGSRLLRIIVTIRLH